MSTWIGVALISGNRTVSARVAITADARVRRKLIDAIAVDTWIRCTFVDLITAT